MKILIIEGTAREGRKSIHAARYLEKKVKENGDKATLFDLKEKEIPPLGNRTYVDDEEPVPENAQELSEEVNKADAIVIVTPEYNHSIPGVLKNAMDHLYPEYDGKDFHYVTVSAGGFGGVRALGHLHDITIAISGNIGSNLPVSSVNSVFNEEGDLIDEEYEQKFEEFAERIGK